MCKKTARFHSACLVCLLVAIAFLTGCKKGPAPLDSANVMFVNGCLSASSISAEANNVTIDGATGITYLTNSGYKYVTAGTGVYLTFFAGNTGAAFESNAVNMTAPDHYTAFAGGSLANPVYLFVTDDLTPPSSGNAKIRFVNLSPDNINESIMTNDTLFAEGISNNIMSPFYEKAAGAYMIKAFDPANKNIVVPGDSTTLQAGKIYTVMLTGTLADSGSISGLTLTVIKNN